MMTMSAPETEIQTAAVANEPISPRVDRDMCMQALTQASSSPT